MATPRKTKTLFPFNSSSSMLTSTATSFELVVDNAKGHHRRGSSAGPPRAKPHCSPQLFHRDAIPTTQIPARGNRKRSLPVNDTRLAPNNNGNNENTNGSRWETGSSPSIQSTVNEISKMMVSPPASPPSPSCRWQEALTTNSGVTTHQEPLSSSPGSSCNSSNSSLSFSSPVKPVRRTSNDSLVSLRQMFPMPRVRLDTVGTEDVMKEWESIAFVCAPENQRSNDQQKG